MQTARKLSELYRDRPVTSRDLATYWVEYVIRHRGAPHLRYHGADLNILQYNSVDVVLFLIAVVGFSLKIFAVLTKFFVSKICKGRKKTKIN